MCTCVWAHVSMCLSWIWILRPLSYVFMYLCLMCVCVCHEFGNSHQHCTNTMRTLRTQWEHTPILHIERGRVGGMSRRRWKFSSKPGHCKHKHRDPSLGKFDGSLLLLELPHSGSEKREAERERERQKDSDGERETYSKYNVTSRFTIFETQSKTPCHVVARFCRSWFHSARQH